MLTVPEVARRVGKDPETVRRWIRSGRLRSRRIGTQHVIEEADLAAMLASGDSVPLPKGLRKTRSGAAMPDWVAIIRAARDAR